MMMKVLISLTLVMCFVCIATSLKCFVCESGNARNPNFDCPMEGQVAFPKVKMSPCYGKCYVRTKGTKSGAIVQRGCLPTAWLKKYLKDGCDVLGNDIWCFCSRSGCNGKRLGEWFPII